jgi:hypothetical protein
MERNPLRELRVWMAEHLTADLSVPALAQRVAMSPRNFQRVSNIFGTANQHLYLTMNQTITYAEPTRKTVVGMNEGVPRSAAPRMGCFSDS